MSVNKGVVVVGGDPELQDGEGWWQDVYCSCLPSEAGTEGESCSGIGPLHIMVYSEEDKQGGATVQYEGCIELNLTEDGATAALYLDLKPNSGSAEWQIRSYIHEQFLRLDGDGPIVIAALRQLCGANETITVEQILEHFVEAYDHLGESLA